MKKITKFKKGDKVRILPSAVDGGVSERAVGKIGVITYHAPGDYFCVLMDYERERGGTWAVYPCQMEPLIRVGQQLLFSFME